MIARPPVEPAFFDDLYHAVTGSHPPPDLHDRIGRYADVLPGLFDYAPVAAARWGRMTSHLSHDVPHYTSLQKALFFIYMLLSPHPVPVDRIDAVYHALSRTPHLHPMDRHEYARRLISCALALISPDLTPIPTVLLRCGTLDPVGRFAVIDPDYFEPPDIRAQRLENKDDLI